MEPEREIEKLLRAYVAKRRAAAGDPLKLHPATRRRLQGEAAATLRPDKIGTTEDGGALWSWLALFRRPAFVLGGAAVVLVGVSLFLPALGSAKKKAQNIGTLSHLKQIGMAAQMVAENNNGRLPASLDDLFNTPGTRNALTDSISGRPFVYVAGGKDIKTLSSNAVLAYAPEYKKERAVLFADGRVALVTTGDFTRLTNPTRVEFALADKAGHDELAKASVNAPAVAAAPPPALTVGREQEMQKSGATVAQSFAQSVAPDQQNLYRNVSPAVQAAPVLQSFQVLQNGNAISVVDRDGSVYQGAVQIAEAERKKSTPVEMSAGAATPGQDQTKAVQSAGNQQQTVQNYFFRVAGMNRTLKQDVVFTGNVEALPGTTTNGPQTVSGTGGGGGGGVGGGVQNNEPISTNRQQWQLSNSRVVGTAVIDGTNQIEINAVPVTP